MSTVAIYNSNLKPSISEKEGIVNFLFKNLDEYGDSKQAISACLDFAIMDSNPSLGGFVLIKKDKDRIQGAVIVNKTGMSKYIPENILVYIAVAKSARGKGIGKKLMQKAIELAEGDLALHVEPDNPAKFLYEKIGFTNKYLEMRYKK